MDLEGRFDVVIHVHRRLFGLATALEDAPRQLPVTGSIRCNVVVARVAAAGRRRLRRLIARMDVAAAGRQQHGQRSRCKNH